MKAALFCFALGLKRWHQQEELSSAKSHCYNPVFKNLGLVASKIRRVGVHSKAFALFSSTAEAERAKIALYRRRFNGRVVEAMFFPEEKMISAQYE